MFQFLLLFARVQSGRRAEQTGRSYEKNTQQTSTGRRRDVDQAAVYDTDIGEEKKKGSERGPIGRTVGAVTHDSQARLGQYLAQSNVDLGLAKTDGQANTCRSGKDTDCPDGQASTCHASGKLTSDWGSGNKRELYVAEGDGETRSFWMSN